jgi:hypothetical protein
MLRRTPPPRAALAAFLRERVPLRVERLAPILGWSPAELRERASVEGVLSDAGSIRWEDATPWLTESWSATTLVDVLGRRDAHLLPLGLHPLQLIVFPAAWIIHALRVQWALGRNEANAETFAEYICAQLRDAVEPDTVAALRQDEEFTRAHEFACGAAEVP